MKKKPISCDSLDDEMRGFSIFGAFPATTKAIPASSSWTSASDSPANNGNTSRPKEMRKPNTVGNTHNTDILNKSMKRGNTDKFVAKTYKFPPKVIELVDRVAYWQRRDKQDVVAEALLKYFEMVPEEDKKDIKRKPR
jgi:hypothetical protein